MAMLNNQMVLYMYIPKVVNPGLSTQKHLNFAGYFVMFHSKKLQLARDFHVRRARAELGLPNRAVAVTLYMGLAGGSTWTIGKNGGFMHQHGDLLMDFRDDSKFWFCMIDLPSGKLT